MVATSVDNKRMLWKMSAANSKDGQPEFDLEKDWQSATLVIASILLLVGIVIWRGAKPIVVKLLANVAPPANWIGIMIILVVLVLLALVAIFFIYKTYSIQINKDGLNKMGFAKRSIQWNEVTEIEVTGRPNSRFNTIVFRSRTSNINISPFIFKKPEGFYPFVERCKAPGSGLASCLNRIQQGAGVRSRFLPKPNIFHINQAKLLKTLAPAGGGVSRRRGPGAGVRSRLLPKPNIFIITR
jgi:hypothetical protein